MKLILLFTLFLSFFSPSLAQDDLPCGTETTQEQIDRINHSMRLRSSSKVGAKTMSNVAISAHIVRKSDATGGLGEEDLNDAIAKLNGFFVDAKLKFFILGDIHYIDDDLYYDFAKSEEHVLGEANDVENTINIYFVNSIEKEEGSGLCGYAYLPNGPDRAFMQNACTVNGTTLSHEIGHFFSLHHTHRTHRDDADNKIEEFVDGSNCEEAGDEICDTPADPKLNLDTVDDNCNYIGEKVDAHNEEYKPDTRNLMSYSRKKCRTRFSEGQSARIAEAYKMLRNYLVSKPLVANFDSDVAFICAGSTIKYKDKSISPATWAWRFPGGTPATSNKQNPQVTYASTGTYGVTLTITDDTGETDGKTFDRLILVEALPNPLEQLEVGFEAGENISYSIRNEGEESLFEVDTEFSSDGSRSMAMQFGYILEKEGYLILNDIDLSRNNRYRLSFDRAYAYSYYDDNNNVRTYLKDSLAILIAPSCSDDWQLFQAWSAEELATAPPNYDLFTPKKSEWAAEQLFIEFDESWESARVAFKAINGYGNKLYLDRVNLEFTDLAIQYLIVDCSSDRIGGKVEIFTTGSGSLSFSLDGVEYQEESIFSDLSAGDYKLHVKQDGNLVAFERFTVTNSTGVDVQISTNENRDLVATSTSKATVFQWYFDGEKVGDGSRILPFLGGGTYLVIATSVSGCSAKSDDLVITEVNKIGNSVLVYPNPAATEINIDALGPLTYEIVDLTGKKMLSGEIISNARAPIQLQALKAGIYLVRIKTNQGHFQQKFKRL